MQDHAPWLLARELAVCAVGSTALAEACRRQKIDGPVANDLDLSWEPSIDDAEALLQKHEVLIPTTEANRQRGTLGLKLAGHRIEITCFRGGPAASLDARIEADLNGRDMTVGAVAWRLSDDRILDPLHGVEHWQNRRIVPVGDPAERIREHPVRWLRYYRRAHQWGFDLDPRIRKVSLDAAILDEVPKEALAAELRHALLQCPSPGRFLMELQEAGLLAVFAPELARQFDGRAAGPVRHHPEIGQGLHMILSLEWIWKRSRQLNQEQRLMVMVAVLCHDMGKGFTEEHRLPSHHGHEEDGIPHLRSLLDRLPGLADRATRHLAEAVCALHTMARGFENLRSGTRARLYERWFHRKDFPVELFALALGADSGGRLGLADQGDLTANKVRRDLQYLRQRCLQVDVGALWEQHGGDPERFKAARHEAYARAVSSWQPE